MSSTSVKVAVRVRPMAAKELLANSSECVEIIPGTQQIMVGGGPACGVGTDSVYSMTQKSFTFDYLLDDTSSQEDLYNHCVSPLVERFLLGFNATILAYGQTGSGKTYSMGIGLDAINPDTDQSCKGIVPRAISTIFNNIYLKKEEGENYKASVFVSFLELYNEELIDLLHPRPRSASNTNSVPTIREDGNGNIIWQNLSEEEVTTTEELLGVLQKGSLCRTTGSTDMNAASSRSHAIFTVTLKQSSVEVSKNEDGTETSTKTNLLSKFHFVDLAGSERLKRTNAEGDRKKEGISINQGLLALGNVISALGDESRRSNHVPYRDSKLTRMLQDSLGGNSQTLMLACVSPSDMNYGETVNTLHYANRARNIKNRVEINQDWGGGETMREIKSLRSTISQLRTEIAMIRANGVQTDASTSGDSNMGVNPKQLMYHQRRERDQLSEIEELRKKLLKQEFQMDQYHFLALRLEKRVRQLLEENNEITKQRDLSVAEKCRLLGGGIDIGRKRRKSSNDNQNNNGTSTPKRSRSPGDSVPNDEIQDLIKGYLTTIKTLRMQLTESEDKLAWQYQAMSKLGGKRAQPRIAWDQFDQNMLGIEKEPRNQAVTIITNNPDFPSFTRQKRILEAIRENIDIRQAHENENPFSIHDMIPRNIIEGETGSRLKFEDTSEACLDVEKQEDNPETDLFLLINSIQNDISRHENLMERNQKREAEYEKMQKAYESKLKVLQNQLQQIQKERDLALQKISTGSKSSEEALRFEEAKRKLDFEISDTQRKLGENNRLRTNNRARTDKLTAELHATIASLKGNLKSNTAEKSRMLQELRQQTQKHRDEHSANMREIAQLRKKEKTTNDTVRRLEKNNEIQRNLLKKRNEEVVKTQSKLKKIMSSLKRAPTPNKIIKPHSSGYSSPILGGPRHFKKVHGPSMNEVLASVNSPVRLSVSQKLKDTNSEEIDVKAQFKKQMIDKELSSAISFRKVQRNLEKLQKCRKRLTDEQKELLAERKRVIEAHYQATGIMDSKSPQYMDDRVKSIDTEIASIDNSMVNLEIELKQSAGEISDDSISTAVDNSWENALNLIRTLTRSEMELAFSYFLEDLVNLRISEEELNQELEDKDNALDSMRQKLFDAQESFSKKNMKFGEIVTKLDSSKNDTVKVQSRKVLDTEPRSRSALSLRRMSPIPEVTSMTIGELEDTLQAPVPFRKSSPMQRNLRPLSPTPLQIFQSSIGDLLNLRTSLGPIKSTNDSTIRESPLLPSLPKSSHDELPNREEVNGNEVEEEVKPRKRFDLLSVGAATDVFKRLANSHTQASQAKVIHRVSVDKEALLHDQSAPPLLDGKRRSFTDLEKSLGFDSS